VSGDASPDSIQFHVALDWFESSRSAFLFRKPPRDRGILGQGAETASSAFLRNEVFQLLSLGLLLDVGDDPAPDGTDISCLVDEIKLLKRERIGLLRRPVVDFENHICR